MAVYPLVAPEPGWGRARTMDGVLLVDRDTWNEYHQWWGQGWGDTMPSLPGHPESRLTPIPRLTALESEVTAAVLQRLGL